MKVNLVSWLRALQEVTTSYILQGETTFMQKEKKMTKESSSPKSNKASTKTRLSLMLYFINQSGFVGGKSGDQKVEESLLSAY